MTTELRFLPHSKHPEAPTLTEIQSATLILGDSFIDVTAAFKQAEESAKEAGEAVRLLATNYEANLSFAVEYPITSREHRQMQTRLSRALRRPALIHKGGKPRV